MTPSYCSFFVLAATCGAHHFCVVYQGMTDKSNEDIGICDECGSNFAHSTSVMTSLCSQCAHALYKSPVCQHRFVEERCTLCLWDGSVSDYVRSIQSES